MRIVFLTLGYPLTERNLYTDLVDGFIEQGHDVTVVRQDETRSRGDVGVTYSGKVRILSIPTGRLLQTNFIRKGINTLLLEYRFLRKISKHKFEAVDVILYSTPPITFQKVVIALKRKYQCISYLLLKDIFPQNAIDIGIIKQNSLLHRFFRSKEKKLYQHSDIIGCMSPANVNYLRMHNPELADKKIHVAPNCIFPEEQKTSVNKKDVFNKYDIPVEPVHFIYGGNLGKPQGVDFIINCIGELKNEDSCFLTIVGKGTEYYKLSNFLLKNNITNTRLIEHLPKEDYLELLSCMNIGMIFLDSRFTIPNFPSRILDYMKYSLPIFACTDNVCDVKQEICDRGAGFWCGSDDIDGFREIIKNIKSMNGDALKSMGKRSRELLIEKYSVPFVVENMLSKINNTL